MLYLVSNNRLTGATMAADALFRPFQFKGLNLKTPTFIASHQDICRILTCRNYMDSQAKETSAGQIQFTGYGPSIDQSVGMEINQLLGVMVELMNRLLFTVFAAMVVITALDVFYQRYEHIKGLRMSRQEIKDEMRESEGDPMIKGRLRQLRMERARKRMMAEVPKADVVVTNPTHYAVALKYDAQMSSPKVVAKGVDKVAQKIREIAKENDVPVVENPPLARGLFAAVEVDQEITPEFYKAVAEVIGYIYKMKRKRL